MDDIPIPDLWSAPSGFTGWRTVGRREFDRANRDGTPTLIVEFRYDDDYRARHYVANRL